ncbi:hypothetical protein H4687_009380 [Streptomyces stelliscabiei]|uniref:Uncharacterized protein n=1 Tax=Streptomyces stelliscabiei TaxID=146820 RepID=A0A8I0PIL1_9ACTN|nr:hypothetical protein [Streptomyces stelliscabiei]
MKLLGALDEAGEVDRPDGGRLTSRSGMIGG